MILEEIKKIKSGEKDLRSFSRVVGLALAVLGGLATRHGKTHGLALLGTGAVLLAVGQTAPGILKPIQKAWMTLALFMGWGMTRILLALLFYLVLTPIGLAARIFGNSFLNLKFKEPDKTTYWISKPRREDGQTKYERQF